jgi:GT2 family glycosyltransferase
MKILVIIVTYNGEKWIERCINSINRSSQKADIFIVDNCSTDKTLNIIKGINSSAKIIESRINLGFGKANNIGIQYAVDNEYDYVYLLNQDAWLEQDTLQKLLVVAAREKSYGILSPFQMNADNHELDNSFKQSIIGRHHDIGLIDDLYFGQLKSVYEVNFVMAAHWMVSIECIKKCGGFSPSFFYNGEDNNYCHRVHYFGFKIGIVPSAKAVHDRAYRKIDCKKDFFINIYTSSITYLSDISHSFPFVELMRTHISTIIRQRHLPSIKYAFRIIYEYPIILRNRKLSKKEGAFLFTKDVNCSN